MHVLIADLHEDRTRIRQQIPRHGEPVTKVGKVAVDAVAPGVTKGFHLLWLAGDWPTLPSLRRGW